MTNVNVANTIFFVINQLARNGGAMSLAPIQSCKSGDGLPRFGNAALGPLGRSLNPNVAVAETAQRLFDFMVAGEQAVDIAAPMMHSGRVGVVKLDQMRFAQCLQKGLDSSVHGRLL